MHLIWYTSFTTKHWTVKWNTERNYPASLTDRHSPTPSAWLAACGSLSLALAEPWIIDRVATLRGQYLREPIDSNALRTCPHSIEVYVEEPPLDWRHEVNSVVTVVSHAWINLTPTPTKREVLIGSNFRSSRPNIFVSSDSLTKLSIKCTHQVRLYTILFV